MHFVMSHNSLNALQVWITWAKNWPGTSASRVRNTSMPSTSTGGERGRCDVIWFFDVFKLLLLHSRSLQAYVI